MRFLEWLSALAAPAPGALLRRALALAALLLGLALAPELLLPALRLCASSLSSLGPSLVP